MQKVVQAILGLDNPLQEDEADALAVALCHLNAPRTGKSPPVNGDYRSRLRPSAKAPRKS